MKIILGYWLDSHTYPDVLGKKDAVIGSVVTGFQGLIGILETQLGLSAPVMSENKRISEWQELIRQHDTGDRPFSRSFETDSWNTAKELLRRRDELVLAGWNPTVHNDGSKWIEAIAQLELANTTGTPGFPERVQTLLTSLQKEPQLSIEQIRVVDEDLTLWDPWCLQLIELLKNLGVKIVHEPALQKLNRERDSDLALYQSVMTGHHEPAEARGDGSLLLVRSQQELDAADFLISWLQAKGTENTVLIKGEGSLLLDELLHRRGVPAFGVDSTSKWRAVLQVLPLTIDTYWQPLNVGRMLELLTIPSSPVPSFVRHRLAASLANSPGIGGPLWVKAIEDGIQSYEEKWLAEEIDEKERKKRRKRLEEQLDLWVRHDYYDPNDGIPIEKLAYICQQVSQWALSNYQQDRDIVYVHAAQMADEVIEGMKTLGVSKIPHLQVARILDSVIGGGAQLSNYGEEAAKWQVVNHPGQVWERADTIVWWGFTKNMSGPNVRTWTTKERQWLRERGVILTDEDVPRRREAAYWQRAAQLAEKRLVLLAPAKVKGEEVAVHPLWDEIRYAVAKEHKTVSKLVLDAGELRTQLTHPLFGTEHERVEMKGRNIPAPIRKWSIPKQVVSPREEESATSFEGLIGCPLKWTMNYAANIRPGRLLSLPNESLMLGNLGHTILEHLIEEKPKWSEEEVRIRTGELFDEFAPQLAATLYEPKNGILRNETRRNLQDSLKQFFKVLNDAGVEIESTEAELQKAWDDRVGFKGRLDIVGRTQTGKKIFFDAKWSRNPNNYKKRLENLSVQLSLYHWLLADHEDEELPVAYFMLRSGHFYSLPHDDFPADYHVKGQSLLESHKVVRKLVGEAWQQLSKGSAFATGVPTDDGDVDEFVSVIDPPCQFCDYQNLCGVRRVSK